MSDNASTRQMLFNNVHQLRTAVRAMDAALQAGDYATMVEAAETAKRHSETVRVRAGQLDRASRSKVDTQNTMT